MESNSEGEVELVYHHTDYAGLIGILNDAKFRFSAIDYLNDSEERTHIIWYIEECLKCARNKYYGNKWVMRLIDHMKSENRLLPTDYYIGCFTKSLNELSQWRGYSRTVPGYALAFRRNALVDATRDVLSKEFYPGMLVANSVTYCGKKNPSKFVDDFIQGKIQRVLSLIDKNGENNDSNFDSYVMNIGDGLSLDFLQKHYPAFYKHESFYAEQEYRVAIRCHSPTNSGGVRFGVTAGAASLKPYLEVEYGKEQMRLLIEKIIIGPTSEEGLACRALNMYGRSIGYDFGVEYCGIPFRPGW